MDAAGCSTRTVRLDRGETLPPPTDFDALVVMGGVMQVWEEDAWPWLADEKRYIRDWVMVDRPYLGICLGHQGIAHMLGGKIEKASEIVHGKVSRLKTVARSSLFKGIPQFFDAMRYHSLVVSQSDFPTDLTITAIEPGTQTIMALEHQNYPLFGLQFHPESIGTKCGSQIMRNFSELCH